MRWPVPEDFAAWEEWGRKLVLALRDIDPSEKEPSQDAIVTVSITAPNAAFTVQHNLDAATAGGLPNVTFEVIGLRHSGAGAGAMDIEYQTGDAVTKDAIDLRLRTGGARVVDAPNPVTAMLRIKRYVPW